MSAPDLFSLTARIRREADRLGFFGVGVARAEPVPLSPQFDEWLSQGMHGEMGYMMRQAAKRRNPQLVLEQVKTLLVLAVNYNSGGDLTEEQLHAKISRYAWGADYHEILSCRLKVLESYIQLEAPGVRTLSYVDTGPVMEKVWGAQTALGWLGKHANLITRERGSWFFIGVILLDVELEYDVKGRDYCGTCTRCIQSCPTRAIVAPYVVDARLCISYLTIELRGKIPRSLRSLLGNRIYGCDDCQEVCPWNRFAVKTPETSFYARAGRFNPELAPLVEITPGEFDRRFKHSPIRRAKRDGFVRNVVVALGNSHRVEAIEPLSLALCDDSPLVRAHAVWALQQIDAPEARRALKEIRTSEADPSVLEEFDPPVKMQ